MWFVENYEDKVSLGIKVKKTLIEEQTPFQKLAIYDTVYFGKLLTLDGIVMLSDADEFVYHEMITHMAMCTHENPQNILVIGGGDGGAIREILKHDTVKKATLCEIDERVTRLSQEYFPQVAGRLTDPKVELHFQDGIKFLQNFENQFDVIITDSTDPIGPAVGLFTEDYYHLVKKALKPDGIMICQSESPWLFTSTLTNMTKRMCQIFQHVETYIAMVPLYVPGCWTLTFASDHYSLKKFDAERSKKIASTCKYYSPEMHSAAIVLPRFIQDLVHNK